MRIGLGIGELAGGPTPLDDLVKQARQAEEEGFASVWLPAAFGVDPFLAAAVIGRETVRLSVGTAVVPIFLLHPVAMAQQALTAQAAARGRFSLGIGLSHQVVVESMLGLSFARPFTHMRQYLAAVAALIRNGTAAYEGSEYRVRASVAVAGAEPCPILLGALAPRMLALAGAVADGTITWMTGPKTLRDYIVPTICAAAAQAGRPAPRVVAGLRVAVTENVHAARAWAARALQFYGHLPSYRAMLQREGVSGPEDIIVVGDEDGVGEQVEQLAAAGVTELLAIPFPVGEERDESLQRTRRLLRALAQSK